MSLEAIIAEALHGWDVKEYRKSNGARRFPLWGDLMPEERDIYFAKARAVTDALRPHDAVKDLSPVILYLGSEADRTELIAAFHEIKPDARAVPV